MALGELNMHVPCKMTIQNTPPLKREQAQPLKIENVYFAAETTSSKHNIPVCPPSEAEW
jgi:hypothetical protein